MGELLARTSSRELSEWMAYAKLEPFGEERADLRAGIVAAVIANANRDPKRRRKPYSPADFMPCVQMEKQQQRERGRGIPMSYIPILQGVFGGTVTQNNESS